MSLLWHYLKQYRKILILALFLAAVNQLFSLMEPQIFRLIIDRFATRYEAISQQDFFQGVLLLIFANMGVAFVSRVAKNFQDYYVNVITQRVGARLYTTSIAHAFSLPFARFEDERSGELLQKLQKARTDAQLFITNAVNILFLSLVGLVFVLGYAFSVHWIIGTVYTLIIPVLGFTTFTISRKIRQAQSRIVKESAELAGSTTETLRNVELVKSLGLEGQETMRLNSVTDRILQLELKKVKLIRALSFIQGTSINGLRMGVLGLMMWLIFSRAITLGEFFSLFIYSFFIFNPLTEMSAVASSYQEARASMEVLEKVLNEPPEAKPLITTPLKELTSIEFRGVDFNYASAAELSVQGIEVFIKPGETVAFVGPSGSGKSTMVKLLVGLYQPTRGTIYVNGVDMGEVDRDEWRKHIGYVSQETQLFAGTIRENLLFVNSDASDGDCLAVLRAASALTIIERGDKGLGTKIGEGGIKLSGGERQRLAIARALLRDPDLIIFDEATSSLDSVTEKAITQTIREITQKRPNLMTVLVAHRLSTVMHADRIYALEKGSMAEQGTHEELIQMRGLYAALWREQVGSSPA